MRKSAALLLLSILACACAESVSLESPPKGEFFFPLGLAAHPAGYALVVNSNFDVRYRHGSLQALDLRALEQRVLAGQATASDNRDLILPEPVLALPNFGGSLAIDSDGRSALAAVACRQTNQVVLVDLEFGEQEFKARCGGQVDTDGFTQCLGSQNVIELDEDDPFSLLLVAEPAASWGERSWTLWTAFLGGGQVVGYHLPAGRHQAGQVPTKTRTIDTNADIVADLARSPASGFLYATSRYNRSASNPVYFFHPDEAKARTLELYSQVLGNQTRGLAFLPDGYTLALAMRDPDSLVFVDTRPGASGLPVNSLLGLVDLDNRPARVFYWNGLLLVSDAEDDSITIIDVRTRRLLQRREDICRGPYDFAGWRGERVVWLLVSCFEENVIAVLDTDPASPDYLKTAARVGKARPQE